MNRSARLFLIATVTDGIVYSAWSLFFNFYILQRGFDRSTLGLINAMPSLATLLLGIPLGMLADRLGRKRSMLLGVAGSILCMGLQVTLASPLLVMAAAFLTGATYSLYLLSQAPFMMQESTAENRTLLFSMNFGLLTLAGVVGSGLAGQLPAWFGAWLGVAADSATAYQAVLICSVGLSLATLVPLALLRERASVPASPGENPLANVLQPASRSVLRVILRPLTMKLAIPNLCIGFGAAILIPYMNVFFHERFALSDQALGLLFSISSLLTGVASILVPRLSANLGSKIKAVVLTQALSLLFLLVVGFSPLLGFAAIGFLMRSILMNMAVPLYSTFAMEQTPVQEQATVNSVKELAWQMGWAVGPYISGLVQQAYGFQPLFVATGLLYALSIGLTWFFFRHSESELPAGEAMPVPAPTAKALEICGD